MTTLDSSVDRIQPSSLKAATKRILVLGYGNPGREDDGLGPAAAAEVERMAWEDVTVSDNYQLVIEDTVDVAKADAVWFIDASRTGPRPYEIYPLSPAHKVEFTTHVMRPEVILALAQSCYGKSPEAYLLGVRGYRFEFREGLTDGAQENLRLAVAALTTWIAASQEASK